MLADPAIATPLGNVNKLWAGLAVLAAAIIVAAIYFGFLRGDKSAGAGSAPKAAITQSAAIQETKLFYAATDTRLRDKPAVIGSAVTGRLQRGDEASGVVVNGASEGEYWLQLAGGGGFVNLANLAGTPAPRIQKTLGSKTILLPAGVNLLAAPSRDATVTDRLSKGFPVTAYGITDNGYLEIVLKKGGTGYIPDGVKIAASAEKPDLPPAIAIKIDGNGCAASAEIDILFKQIIGRQAAGLKRVEEAKYADDDARDAAIARYRQRTEGKSVIVPLERSFRGLTVTGIGVHPESQSVYFSEKPDQVRSVFRSIGYRVGRDGKLPSREIYASIDASNSRLGKTDMGCGV